MSGLKLSRRRFCVLAAGAMTGMTPCQSSSMLSSARPPADSISDSGLDGTFSFSSPPNWARPYVLWMWMGSNISKVGITKDLEAMKDAGIGGATIFSLADSTVPWAGFIDKSPTPQIVTFTEPWWEMMRHAASEAYRLGLELILHNCAGYESSGGPWITPELSMQEVVWSETRVDGGKVFNGRLEQAKVDPHPHAQFPEVYIPELGRIDIPIVDARNSYYHDIAVIAVPSSGIAGKEKVLLLSDKMSSDNTLHWDAPEGTWIVYRFGHTTTGAMIQPAQWGAMGLECDKMSRDAVLFHVRHVLEDMKRHLGDLMGKGITTLYFDSYEAGTPTWTPNMTQEFSSRRGYELIPWLPVLAGRTVDSANATAHFQKDFERTRFDLYRDCYWASLRAPVHAAGLKLVAEPYEGPWVIGEVIDHLDIPAVEFWTHDNTYSPVALQPVMAAAHALGKNIIAAEAFTSSPEQAQWNEHPGWLKTFGDQAFCDGVNRLNMHHFVHQPWDDKYKPGNAMGQWGVHFGRNQTWWKPGKAWITYLWRCQNLLQRGKFVEPSPATSPTFSQTSSESKTVVAAPNIKSIRRDVGGAAVFFVANSTQFEGRVRSTFPISGRQPELWDPVWGTMRDIESYDQEEGMIHLDLEFHVFQSYFIIFRKPMQNAVGKTAPQLGYRIVATLDGSWDVSFDPAWGGPESIVFPALTDWSTHPDSGVKYYSGTAIYRKTVRIATPPGRRVWLDIGKCHHLAEVTVNRKPLGVVWTAPWHIDVSDVIKQGENLIEIAVTNVWANRLIGDEQHEPDWKWEIGDPKIKSGEFMKAFPDWFLKGTPRPSHSRYTFTTWNYFNNRSALTPSGLIGPVTIRMDVQD